MKITGQLDPSGPLCGSEHLHTVDFRCLPVAIIERCKREPEVPRQIEIQGVVSLEMVPPSEFHHPTCGEQLKVHADI